MATRGYSKPGRGVEALLNGHSAGQAQQHSSSVLKTYRRIQRLRRWVDGPKGIAASYPLFEQACERLLALENELLSTRSANALDIITKVAAVALNPMCVSLEETFGTTLISEVAAVVQGTAQ